MKHQEDFIGVRMIEDFQAEHCPYGKFVLLHTSFIDSMSLVCVDKATDYPDQELMIRLDVAKKLIRELQKRVDYIEAGIAEDNNTAPL